MTTSNNGIRLIKSFEGLQLKAYKALPTEPYYTIGYGHYGKDVSSTMEISEYKAEQFLKEDLAFSEECVNKLDLCLNQNQFDALVSFTYNCGSGNLSKLVNGRGIRTIGEKILLYNKANGKVVNGLVRRRQAECDLFFNERKQK